MGAAGNFRPNTSSNLQDGVCVVLNMDCAAVGLNFRQADEADFAAVVELATQLAVHIEQPAPPLTMANFADFYLAPGAPMRLLLAETEGRVVGLIAWTLTHELYSGERRVYISDISVDKAARGRGVGKALLAQVAEWGCAHGAAKMGWEVWYRNTEAKAFYEKLGAVADEEAIPYGLTLMDSHQRTEIPL